MTTRKLTNLMMRSCDYNPYSGKLSEKQNINAAIDLAKLLKDFAEKGYTDEAMNVDSNQWQDVIYKLQQKKQKHEKPPLA